MKKAVSFLSALLLTALSVGMPVYAADLNAEQEMLDYCPITEEMRAILNHAGFSNAEIALMQSAGTNKPRDYVVTCTLKSPAYGKNVSFSATTDGVDCHWTSYGTASTPSGFSVSTSGSYPLTVSYSSSSCPNPCSFKMKLNLNSDNDTFPTRGDVEGDACLERNSIYVNGVSKYNTFYSYVDFSLFKAVGDVDNDGVITLLDLGYVVAAVSGDPTFDPDAAGVDLSDCDVNLNGSLDSGDFAYYTSYLARNVDSLWGNPPS